MPISSWFLIIMLKFVVLLCAVACTLGAAIPEGMLPQLDGRIVGGIGANIINNPWLVSLQRYGHHTCGGSIYSSTVIVTAAHCLKSAITTILRVRSGSPYWHTGGTLVSVAAFKPHPNFDMSTKANDIGVVRVSIPFKFSDKVKPIALATTIPNNGAAAVIAGWGSSTSGDISISSRLRQANVKIVGNRQCASKTYNYGTDAIKPTMICATGPSTGSCKWDSGGPLVSGGVVVGVFSMGGCANPKYPGVYANVAPLSNWVKKNAATV